MRLISRKTIIWTLIIALVFVSAAIFIVPHFVRASAYSPSHECQNNLRVIEAAKDQWAVENNKMTNDTPTWDDIRPYMSLYLKTNKFLKCPEGGIYTLGKVGQLPTCSIGGYHSIQ
jgi:hypothetical protein